MKTLTVPKQTIPESLLKMTLSLLFSLSALLLSSLVSRTSGATPQLSCLQALENKNDPSTRTIQRPIRSFLKDVATGIKAHREDFKKLLLKYDNIAGAELELELVDRLLGPEMELELYNLENLPTLENIAVYGATNVPFYTLIAHGVIPKSVSNNVWFRTPELTRQLYLELYQLLVESLPSGTLNGLNMVSESQKVQYQTFNKIYVMGMNKHGTRIEGRPANMVIFTGNPDTARSIVEENIQRIKEKAVKLGFKPFKQVFLGFGAGINPIIIPESALTNLQQVVHWSMEPIRINSGQDCLAADFIAVHSGVAEPYIRKLTSEIRQLKGGPADNPESGFTPLTMNKRFDLLKAYRDQYQDYLVNKEAFIDDESKLVSPHVFVFPFSKFKEVHLQEHFAPFFTIFTYDGRDELEQMARDERVQSKTMYASILGGNAASKDISEARLLFRSTRHHVLVNETLFGDLHPNMPYGGKGTKTSMIVNFDYDPESGLHVTTGHRPKLFSTEAFQAFGPKTVEPKNDLRSHFNVSAKLQALVRSAKLPAQKLSYMQPSWSTLQQPFYGQRPRGLDYLRQMISKHGLFITTNQPIKSEQDFLYQWGARPLQLNNMDNSSFAETDGVLIHQASVGKTVYPLNTIRGTLNPNLGWGNLLGLMDSNKYNEFILAEAVQPGVMAHTESFELLRDHGLLSETLKQKQLNLKLKLSQIVREVHFLTNVQREDLRKEILSLLENLMTELRAAFPEGGYIKNYGEFATADLGTQITTFASPVKPIAEEFLRRFDQSLRELYENAPSFESEIFQDRMNSNAWELGNTFVNRLLLDDSELLIQSRVKIAKTALGAPLEMRVDFIDGEPVHTRARFTNEYLPEDVDAATKVIQTFFNKAPEQFRYLSGGADVAKLEDGSWTIIEFNFGSSSGTLNPRYFPIDANLFFGKLQGAETPFIKDLNSIFKAGPDHQKAYLKTLKNIRPLFWKPKISDISVTEVAKYFRDLYLEEFRLHPDSASAEKILAALRTLTADWQDQEEVVNIIRSAEYYLRPYLVQK